MNTYKVYARYERYESVDADSFAIVQGDLIFYDGAREVAAFSSWLSVTTIEDETESADQNE